MTSQTYKYLCLLFALNLLLVGCAVGPNYTTPDIPVPKQWVSDAASIKAVANPTMQQVTPPRSAQVVKELTPFPAVVIINPHATTSETDTGATEQEWWKQFHDPVLDELIKLALAENLELQMAEARLEQARAIRASSTSSLFPKVSAKGSAIREANQIAIPQAPANYKNPFNIFQTGFDASWELDLFGGIGRQVEASTAVLEATIADRDAFCVSLLAEIARTYVDIRQYQEQIGITKSIVTIERNSVLISQQRFDAGDAPGIDVSQALAQAEEAEAQLPVYENLLKQAEFSLDVLLGRQPGAAAALVEFKQPLPKPSATLVLDAPAAVVANRPDIRAAERRLQEATAQQGVATAKFYPNISLSGFVGLLSTDANTLFQTANKSWMGGSSVILPILNFGELSANLDYADARQVEALANYRKVVIAALSDVERAVTAFNKQRDHYAALAQVVEKNERVARIAAERYREGLTSFLDVLIAQQLLYKSRGRLEQASAEVVQNLIAIYKSVGRGWKSKPSSGFDTL